MSKEYICDYCGKEVGEYGHEPPYPCLEHLRRKIDSLQNMVEKQAYTIDKLKLEILRYHGKC